MYCYNLGVHDLATGQAVMYVWDECMASRGSQEIASCIVKHITLHATTHNHIVIYSDTCTGQNRNIKVALSLMKLVQASTCVDVVEQKFMVSGHSYLPNDSDFGLIELSAKGKPIYLPDDWYNAMASARKRSKFIIVKMKAEDFFSTQPLEKAIVRRSKNIDNEAVKWHSIQWLRYEKDKPFQIMYKTRLDVDEPFQTLDVRPKLTKGRPTMRLPEQELLYKEPCIINALKKRDMLFLLKYIPVSYTHLDVYKRQFMMHGSL